MKFNRQKREEIITSKKKETWGQEIKRNWQLYLMLALPFIYIVVFKYYPMVGAQIAFRKYVPAFGIWGSKWVGLYQFERMFSHPIFWKALKNTITLSTYTLLLSIPIPIVLAICFEYARGKFFRKSVQMSAFLPHFLSTVILVSLINLLFDNRTGVFIHIIQNIFGAKVNVLGDAKFFRHLYVWSGIWQGAGWSSILYISALSGVDTQIHEAAIIDGANKWRRIWHIDLPSIRPTIAIMTIMSMGSILSVGFDKTYMMQNPINYDYSEVLATLEFSMGTAGSVPDYSFAAAIGLAVSVVSFVMVMITNKISKTLSDNSLW
ncbi:MAG: sugar ABC transporter permease [Clostridia bacterium]|nr:sugar ABC transporter permease [Clostridia bacterium]